MGEDERDDVSESHVDVDIYQHHSYDNVHTYRDNVHRDYPWCNDNKDE